MKFHPPCWTGGGVCGRRTLPSRSRSPSIRWCVSQRQQVWNWRALHTHFIAKKHTLELWAPKADSWPRKSHFTRAHGGSGDDWRAGTVRGPVARSEWQWAPRFGFIVIDGLKHWHDTRRQEDSFFWPGHGLDLSWIMKSESWTWLMINHESWIMKWINPDPGWTNHESYFLLWHQVCIQCRLGRDHGNLLQFEDDIRIWRRGKWIDSEHGPQYAPWPWNMSPRKPRARVQKRGTRSLGSMVWGKRKELVTSRLDFWFAAFVIFILSSLLWGAILSSGSYVVDFIAQVGCAHCAAWPRALRTLSRAHWAMWRSYARSTVHFWFLQF